MGLAIELHRAHRERVAKIAAAASRVRQDTPLLNRPVLTQKPVTEAVPENFGTGVAESIPSRLAATADSVELILRAVCKVTGVHYRDLRSWRRRNDIAEARQIAMWVILTGIEDCKTEWAGKVLNRHHTTVIYGWEQIEAEKERHRTTIWHVGVAIGLPLLAMERERTRPKMSPFYAARLKKELEEA